MWNHAVTIYLSLDDPYLQHATRVPCGARGEPSGTCFSMAHSRAHKATHTQLHARTHARTHRTGRQAGARPCRESSLRAGRTSARRAYSCTRGFRSSNTPKEDQRPPRRTMKRFGQLGGWASRQRRRIGSYPPFRPSRRDGPPPPGRLCGTTQDVDNTRK